MEDVDILPYMGYDELCADDDSLEEEEIYDDVDNDYDCYESESDDDLGFGLIDAHSVRIFLTA